MKILLLKPSSLGDVIQALPVLRLLKRALPSSEIFWWIDSQLAPLLEQDPDLAGIVRFDRKRWAAPRHWGELWQSVRWMRRQNFDWVIDLQCLFRSATVAWLANGKLTVGLDEPREGARGFYDLIPPHASPRPHAVQRYLSVLPLLGIPHHWNFVWLPERPSVASELRSRWPVGSGRWVVIQPGARWSNKRWPIEYFCELVKSLPNALRFAILGSTADAPLGQAIAASAPDRCVDMTGHLSLLEMIECIRCCELMVTNDTGPMHVAAALQKPVVALFGPTDPRRTGPHGQLENVLRIELPCSPCLKSRCTYSKPMECLRAIRPETVIETVQRRLNSLPL